MDKVSQSYWDSSYAGYQYGIADDAVTSWLKKYLADKKGSVFEAGCYPGRYLAFLGKQGWTVSGMDLTPRMDTDFKDWLTKNQIQFRKIEKGDVLEYMRAGVDKYDLVCSFGFIEHFENFPDVIALHDKILRPAGQLIITTPHFKGAVQNFLHGWLDRENLERHHLPSMNPALWKRQLDDLGYTVTWQGYFGNFDFWADRQKRNLFNKGMLKLVTTVTPAFRWLPNSRIYSPYCGIVAQKNSQ